MGKIETIKLTDYDRANALSRNSEFLSDFKNAILTQQTEGLRFNSKKANAFCKKYGLDILTVKNTVDKRDPRWIGKEIIFSDQESRPLEIESFGPMIIRTVRRIVNDKEVDCVEASSIIKGGRYVTIEFDFWRTQAENVNKLKEYMKVCEKHTRRLGSCFRTREVSLDPWKIYDKHIIGRKSFLAIAREIYGHKGKREDGNEADRDYQRVKNAYEKACRMIKIAPEGV